MQKNDKFFEDMAKVFNNAMGTMAGMKTDIEAMIRHQFQFLLKDLDLVTREEFEAVRQMAATAREEQEKLTGRMAVLEQQLQGHSHSSETPKKSKK